MIDTTKVKAASDALWKAYEARDKAIADLNKVRGLGGQTGYAVTVNGVRVDVAEMDRYYNGALIRGREMIHLGALKALQANVDFRKQDVAAREAELKELTR